MSIHSTISKKYNIRMKQSYYSKIERGIVEPPLRTLYAIADYFGVNITHFFDPPDIEQHDKLHYILHNPSLYSLLVELEAEAGPKKAAEYLKVSLKLLLDMLSEFKDKSSTLKPLPIDNQRKRQIKAKK